MNWQWPITRAIASSIDLPIRRRCAATSMKGMACGREMLVHGALRRLMMRDIRAGLVSRRRGAAPCGRRSRGGPGRGFEASRGDLEAGDALVAGHRRRGAGAHRLQEGDQLGPQRLVVADRQMTHRIAAVGLEAEAFGDLARQEIAHHIFAAGRDRDVARLERRQPVGVDVREHAGGGAELQAARCPRARPPRWRAAAAPRRCRIR